MYLQFQPVPARSPSAGAPFLDQVRALVSSRLGVMAQLTDSPGALVSGKLLRSRLVARLRAVPGFQREPAVVACAATELVHSASLVHDDIIDGSALRRGAPTMWRQIGIPGAILGGDLLLVQAFSVLPRAGRAAMVSDFCATLVRVCDAEVKQELVDRGRPNSAARWEAICRGKTGELFAFPARWSCPDAPALSAALSDAAASVGVAYQMFDDLLDIYGDSAATGKDAGADARRGKHTVPAAGAERLAVGRAAIQQVLARARQAVRPWPHAEAAVSAYIDEDLAPLFASMLHGISAC